MKVFISQPMRGRSQEEIEERRNNIINTIRDRYLNENIEFVYSIIEQEPSDDIEYVPVWYLSKSIEKLSTATIAYFDKGWEKADGCIIELKICKLYGIPTVFYTDFN